MKKLIYKYLSSFLVVLISFALLSCGSNDIVNPQPKPKPKPPTPEESSSLEILEVNSNGELLKGDKLFYGIGVNYFNSFTRILSAYPNTDTSSEAGLKYLSDNEIPFIRFSINGFWPTDQRLYLTNPAKYFQLLDKFVATAEKLKIGLIPSFFWNHTTISDIYGEPVWAWGNTNSKTIAHMKQFTNEVLTRYKDSKIIWGWEFSNEVNLRLDILGMTDKGYNYSPVNPSQGTPVSREKSDTLTTDQFNIAVNEFAKVVKKYDNKRPIFTGNGMTSGNAYGKHYRKSYSPIDNVSEWKEAVALQNKHVNTITIHPYAHQHEGIVGRYFDYNNGATLMQLIKVAKEISISTKKPLFIGEFGVSEKYSGDKVAKFNDYIKAIVDNKVQLSALWVFDFSFQDNDWHITPTNNRKYQLDAIISANKILKEQK